MHDSSAAPGLEATSVRLASFTSYADDACTRVTMRAPDASSWWVLDPLPADRADTYYFDPVSGDGAWTRYSVTRPSPSRLELVKLDCGPDRVTCMKHTTRWLFERLAEPAGAIAFEWKNLPERLHGPNGTSIFRLEDGPQPAHRLAADDLVLTSETRIDKVTWYGADAGSPDYSGLGDLYFYAAMKTGNGYLPGELVFRGRELPMRHERVGWKASGGMPAFANVMRPDDLRLPAGRYFVAFRALLDSAGSGKNTSVALSVQDFTNGAEEAVMNAEVSAEGVVGAGWKAPQAGRSEWLFRVEGLAAK